MPPRPSERQPAKRQKRTVASGSDTTDVSSVLASDDASVTSDDASRDGCSDNGRSTERTLPMLYPDLAKCVRFLTAEIEILERRVKQGETLSDREKLREGESRYMRAYLPMAWTLFARPHEVKGMLMDHIALDQEHPISGRPYDLVAIPKRNGNQYDMSEGRKHHLYTPPDDERYSDVGFYLRDWRKYVDARYPGEPQPAHLLFPSLTATGSPKVTTPWNSINFDKLLARTVAGANLMENRVGGGKFTAQCTRSGGAQWRFLHPTRPAWRLDVIQQWGGWSVDESVDTLLKYLMEPGARQGGAYLDALTPNTTPDTIPDTTPNGLERKGENPASTEELSRFANTISRHLADHRKSLQIPLDDIRDQLHESRLMLQAMYDRFDRQEASDETQSRDLKLALNLVAMQQQAMQRLVQQSNALQQTLQQHVQQVTSHLSASGRALVLPASSPTQDLAISQLPATSTLSATSTLPSTSTPSVTSVAPATSTPSMESPIDPSITITPAPTQPTEKSKTTPAPPPPTDTAEGTSPALSPAEIAALAHPVPSPVPNAATLAQCIDQWNNADPERGLPFALKDWPVQWQRKSQTWMNRSIIAQGFEMVGQYWPLFHSLFGEKITAATAKIREELVKQNKMKPPQIRRKKGTKDKEQEMEMETDD